MSPLRKPTVEFLKAQKLRLAAHEQGVYTLRDGEGFHCTACGWRGLSAPMAEESFAQTETDAFTQCPECGELGPETSGRDIEPYRRFGYPYDVYPEDVEEAVTSSPDEYVSRTLSDETVGVVVAAALLGLFEDEGIREMYDEELEVLSNQHPSIRDVLSDAGTLEEVEAADVGLTRRQLECVRESLASMTDGSVNS